MTTLTQQLELLKEQQEELEKRIQKEKEHKKKLNNEASIERLEALVEPITTQLDYDKHKSLSRRKEFIIQYECSLNNYNNAIAKYPNGRHGFPPKKVDELEKEEIYVTLIGILKKQDERIKELEKKIG
tara:strand:+ start:63 stop:446 length:384 start_codon:yes stop_codon:yes gene_type:complete